MPNAQSAPLDDFALQLEENAKDSLRHGIEHLLSGNDASNLKQAILEVYHAAELFLKARLAKEHHTLIFEKPENANSPDAYTVGLETALARLKTVNVIFEDPELSYLKHIKRVRNRLEHHQYSGKRQETEDLIASTVKVLEGFLTTELSLQLSDFLDADTVLEIEKLILSYAERLGRAQERASDASECRCDPKDHCACIAECPACGEDTVPCPDSTDKIPKHTHCYFCGEEYFINYCDRCEQLALSDVIWDDDPENYPNLCDVCSEYRRSQD